MAITNRRAAILVLLVAVITSATPQQVIAAPTNSATTLSIERQTSVVRIGVVLKLTATVVGNSLPVSHGVVKFCDADAARCEGLALLGAAQLNSSGSATLRLTRGPGTYQVKAVFCGTPHGSPPIAGSSSKVESITITGNKTSSTGGRS